MQCECHRYQIYCSKEIIPLMNQITYRVVISNAEDVPSNGTEIARLGRLDSFFL